MITKPRQIFQLTPAADGMVICRRPLRIVAVLVTLSGLLSLLVIHHGQLRSTRENIILLLKFERVIQRFFRRIFYFFKV